MPTILCQEGPACPLSTADPLPKFCPECGALASSKVKPANTCKACSHDFGDVIPKFCPECGARAAEPPPAPHPEPGPSRVADGERSYGSLSNLIADHEARRAAQGLPGGRSGRGLTAEELERLERNARKATPAHRKYQGPQAGDAEAYKNLTGLDIPDDDPEMRRRAGLGEHRVAEHAKEGTHRPGGLSARGSRLDPGYHNDVRLIPYSFRNPASRGRQVVGPQTRAEEEADPHPNPHRQSDDELDKALGQLGNELTPRRRSFDQLAAAPGDVPSHGLLAWSADKKQQLADDAMFRPDPGDEDVPDIVFPPKPKNL